MSIEKKQCSICGVSKPLDDFCYGGRENRSYCKDCDREEKAADTKGGAEAARSYREERRKEWK